MDGGTAESHGPMYGITSMNAVHSPNRSAYSSAPSTRPGGAEDPHPDSRARADHEREDQLTLHIAPQRPLDPLRQGQAAVRREIAVDRPLQPRHVEQHVDRDDDDEDHREEEEDGLEGGALREREDVLRITGDVPGRQRVDPVVVCFSILIDSRPWSLSQRLKPVDVDLGPRLPGASASSVT